MPSSPQVILVFTWLMLQQQTSCIFIMTKENGLEPPHWDTKIFAVESASGFQLFSSRKGPAKFAHTRQVEKAMLSSQILVLQFLLTKQEHKEQTKTKPQCETQLKTKMKKMPNEKYQSVILRLLHVVGERAELTFEVKSTFFLYAISGSWSFS